MKKMLLVSICLFMIVSLIACDNNKSNTMVIQESEFSKETQEVLKIIDNEIAFFDYKVNETIKSMFIDIWVYEDGKWENLGGTQGNMDTNKGQIALRLNENSYDIFTIDESGHTKYSYKDIIDVSKTSIQFHSRLDKPTSIESDKEIVLWETLGSNKNYMVSKMDEDFREADCDAGVVVTITFSDKNVD